MNEALMESIQELRADGEDIILYPGFEDALIGLIERCGSVPIALYDAYKAIEILMERDGMDEMDAQEFIEYNYTGAFIGEYTPYWLWRD